MQPRLTQTKRRLRPKLIGHRSHGKKWEKRLRKLAYWQQYAREWAPFVSGQHATPHRVGES